MIPAFFLYRSQSYPEPSTVTIIAPMSVVWMSTTWGMLTMLKWAYVPNVAAVSAIPAKNPNNAFFIIFPSFWGSAGADPAGVVIC